MEVVPINGPYDSLYWDGWTVSLVPSDPNGRFRLVPGDGRVGDDPVKGTEIRVNSIPDSVSSQLPYQRDETLLDMHLPPDPERPNVRSSGNYLLRLAFLGGGSVTTSASFEEIVPAAALPES